MVRLSSDGQSWPEISNAAYFVSDLEMDPIFTVGVRHSEISFIHIIV